LQETEDRRNGVGSYWKPRYRSNVVLEKKKKKKKRNKESLK